MNKIILSILCGLIFATSEAAIVYDKEADAICVSAYPENAPCTMKKLLKMEQMNEWGKITYDKNTDTYRIECSLWIGDDNKTDTFFQIGDKDNPFEKVIIRGNLFVKPYWNAAKEPDKKWWTIKSEKYTNRLTIGDERNTNVKASLFIDNNKTEGFTIIIGGAKKDNALGGQLHIYNGKISSLSNSPRNGIGAKKGKNMFWEMGSSDSIIIKNSVISGVSSMIYGFMPEFGCYGLIEDTVFENSKSGFAGNHYTKFLKNCTFRNCEDAIFCMGKMNLILQDCVFENNIRNWNLETGDAVLTLIDCKIGLPKEANSQRSTSKIKSEKKSQYSVIVKRHIIVNVTDSRNKPVENAKVSVTPIDGKDIDGSTTKTGADGLTPEKNMQGTLLLTESVTKSDDGTLISRPVRYRIEVEAAGFKTAVTDDVKVDENRKSLSIVLKTN